MCARVSPPRPPHQTQDHYHEVLTVLEEVFLHIFEGLNQRCSKEIEAVRAQYPFVDLKFERPALRLRYQEAVALLRKHGPEMGAERLAALEAQQQAAVDAGNDEDARDLAQQVKDMKEHLKGVPLHKDDEDISTRDEKLLGAIMNRYKNTGEAERESHDRAAAASSARRQAAAAAPLHTRTSLPTLPLPPLPPPPLPFSSFSDFYVIDKFPAELRPFYTMPDPDDPKWSNSYDIFIRGEEVTSGAQRIHDPQMLLDNAASKEPPVDLSPIKDYIDSFSYGAFPHAGGGIGMERVVMLFLGLDNIRKSSMFPRDPQRLSP